MAVLLLAEMNGAELSLDATAKAVSAAKTLGDVTVLCASSGCNAAATEASQIDGVSKVLCADDEAYGNGLAEPISDLVVALSSDFEHIGGVIEPECFPWSRITRRSPGSKTHHGQL